MQAVIWDESLVIGHDAVDAQHQYLFELASMLLLALERGQSESVVQKALDALEAYTKQHFLDEEMLLEALASPHLEEHRQMHASLLLDLQDLRSHMISRMPKVGEYVVKWVTKCLIPHIRGADMEALKGVQPSAT